MRQAIQINAKYIFLIGGKTNPKYITLSEAEANKKIIDDLLKLSFQSEVVVLPIGNTAAEGLIVVKKWIMEKKISVGTLLLCGEQSRIVNFQLDALQVGLLDLSRTIMAYGCNFSESKDNFKAERRKVLLHCLSHEHWFWNRIRLILQKRHQKRMAKKSKALKEIDKLIRSIRI